MSKAQFNVVVKGLECVVRGKKRAAWAGTRRELGRGLEEGLLQDVSHLCIQLGLRLM